MSHAFVTAMPVTTANMIEVVHYMPIMKGVSVQWDARCHFTQPLSLNCCYMTLKSLFFSIFFFWHVAFRNPVKGQKHYQFLITIAPLRSNMQHYLELPFLSCLPPFKNEHCITWKESIFLFGVSLKWTVDFRLSTTELFFSSPNIPNTLTCVL